MFVMVLVCDVCWKAIKQDGVVMCVVSSKPLKQAGVCDVCSEAVNHVGVCDVCKEAFKKLIRLMFVTDMCSKTFNQATVYL